MKRLITLLILTAPSIALAHPGHEHIGVTENHHISSSTVVIAAVLAIGSGLALARWFRNKSND